MTYTVKEIFKTIQGEGANVGRVAVFCRFAGCNLSCAWCDTDYSGGRRFASADDLVDAIESEWGSETFQRFVVFTGGEPMLQLDRGLIAAVKAKGFKCAIETNGTRRVPSNVDWICVSPKPGVQLVQRSGNELKLVYPQPNFEPDSLHKLTFDHWWLQPMDGPDREGNTAKAVAYCLANPRWRLSLQTHKYIGIQ